MTLEVGQKLWFVPPKRQGSPSWVTVNKVGRKWAAIDMHMRIDINTLAADGGNYSSPGQCYLSKEAYEAEVLLNETWDRFKDLVSRQWTVPSGVRISQIENAARALFGTSVLKAPPKSGGDAK